MKVRRLGWAGVELEARGSTLVIDPLADANAVFAPLGATPETVRPPEAVAPSRPGAAVAGLVTHLHRDHTDAAALRQALAPEAEVLRPVPGGGGEVEELGLAQAEAELAEQGLATRAIDPWQTLSVGSFELAALPAADGLGDPQLSWVVAGDGVRVAHFGDTLFHGWWWRAALRHGPIDVALLPINGAVIKFPHRRPASPLPAAMTPEEAALAGELLRASIVIPIHYGGYDFEPFYRPAEDAEERFLAAASGRSYGVRVLAAGETLEVAQTALAS